MKLDALTDAAINALFETIPMELSIIDENDKVVGWNKHHSRLFYRPEACMEMDFRQCHPEKSLPLVEKIIGEMKAGTREKARFWIDATVDKAIGTKHKVVIEFFALRDPQGKYIGCMECSQDIEDLIHLEGEKRLMDEKFD